MSEAAPIRIARNGPVVRLILFFTALLAFLLSCHAATSCAFLVAQHEFYESDGLLVTGLYRTNGGISTRTCTSVDYLRDVETNNNQGGGGDFPTAFKAARAFAVMAPMMGFVALVFFFLCLATERFNNKIWFQFVIPSLLLASSILQILTFSAFGIDQCTTITRNGTTFVGKCIFADGANASLAAMMLYILPAIPMVFACVPTPRHPLLILYSDGGSPHSTGSTAMVSGSVVTGSNNQEQVALTSSSSPTNNSRPRVEQQDSSTRMYIEDDSITGEPEQPIEVEHGKDP